MKKTTKHVTRMGKMSELAKDELIQGIYAMKLLERQLKSRSSKKQHKPKQKS